jgi:23S rRNA (cytidine1920-2'-O)/16S rRNA (cytidine1409-2'-O)-methyltransferase
MISFTECTYSIHNRRVAQSLMQPCGYATIGRLKIRLDKLLLERGLATSRERAQALVLAGRVLVNEQKIDKAGAAVDSEVPLRVLGDDLRYVSRGGLKLERALEHWSIALRGRVCLDIGTSTGGFVDCMLQHGAAKVVAVDTGRGQIAGKLRNDPRLRLLENYNARFLKTADVPEPVTFFSMDVSFISATLVVPAVIETARTTLQDGIVLVKPQFEAGRDAVSKGGIVRDEAAQAAAIERVRECVVSQGAVNTEAIESPILGGEGNREFLLYVRFQ